MIRFLIQSPHSWRGLAQRPHHLARRFAAAGHQVHWVEPRYLRWLLQGRIGEFVRARAESPSPGLTVRPRTLINGERLGFIRAHNKYWLARSLRQAPASPEISATILWLYNPHEEHLADRVAHDLLIYDIMDEYRGFPWSPPRIVEEESRLLERADWVFTGTRALYDAKRHLAGDRMTCELSGVESERFDEAAPHAEMLALRRRYRRVAGYAGMIDLRVDVEALQAAARAFPDWGFVLVGPERADLTHLDTLPNVHRIGERPYEELPGLYHGWDVALLPFVENELTRHINPTKMLEYAAAGLPIVARGLPELRRVYAEGAWLYDTTDEFIEQLQAAGSADAPDVRQRIALAQEWSNERSWDQIAQRMLERVSRLLDSRSPGRLK